MFQGAVTIKKRAVLGPQMIAAHASITALDFKADRAMLTCRISIVLPPTQCGNQPFRWGDAGPVCRALQLQPFRRSSSGSLAMLAAMRLVSSRVSRLAARPASEVANSGAQ